MKDSKRHYLPSSNLLGRIDVVATPIGNLGDFSPRATQALQQADIILCEDTRKTSQLMSALAISTQARLERCDAHQEKKKQSQWHEYLHQGKRLVLVSDAGTPGLSDPGAAVIQAAIELGAIVSPIPGSSAVAALLSVAPFSSTPFVFKGFFPRKTSDQTHELEAFQKSAEWSPTAVWFESPQRIEDALKRIAIVLPRAKLWVGKELTKIYEKFFYGTATEVAKQVAEEISNEGPKGEWCFAVFLPESEHLKSIESDAWKLALGCLLDAGVPASQAARQVSQTFGVAKNTAYQQAILKDPEKNAEGD